MPAETATGEVWLTRQELADRWQLPTATLAKWASAGNGPEYATFGRHVRYALSAVTAFEQSQTAARD